MYKKLVIMIAALTMSSFANADMKPHPYLSASLGNADYADVDVTDTSFAITGGYYASKNLKMEASYTDLGSEGSVSASAISLVVVGAAPLNETIALFARGGIANGKVKDGSNSYSTVDVTYGFGVSFRIAEKANINASYDMYTVGDDDFNVDVSVLALGATVHF